MAKALHRVFICVFVIAVIIFLSRIMYNINDGYEAVDAQFQCLQLAVAIEAFHNKYDKWPLSLAELASTGNKDKITFHTHPTSKNPWGYSLNFAVDLNTDGQVDIKDGNIHTPSVKINARVAVWSKIPGEGAEAANSWN